VTSATSYPGYSPPGTTFSPYDGTYMLWLSAGLGELYSPEATTATQTVLLGANDQLTGFARFLAFDASPFNDSAEVRIYDSQNNWTQVFYKDVSMVGNYGDSDWTSWSFTALTAGTYTVEYSVTNYIDNWPGTWSQAVFDAEVPPPVVPLPAALWLLGPGLAGLAAVRRRFTR
jgi:hypothetical protein